jgi:voltage-gated sodium channel
MNHTKEEIKPFAGLFLNDRFILILILINSISLFAEGFQELGPLSLFYIALVDSIITMLFLIEAIVKIKHFGWENYIVSSWNKFDFVLVLLSLPSIFLLVIHGSFEGLSFLLILRVSRAFKFFRFFKFIPGINQLVIGIQRALRTSVFVLFGFFVFNFIISILSCYMFKDLSPDQFGNPVKSMYTIFRIFTIEGWYDIPDKMAMKSSEMVSVFIKLYFVVVLILGGILGLSLVNSIFVDSMVMDNNDELEKKVDLLNEKIEILLKKYEGQ